MESRLALSDDDQVRDVRERLRRKLCQDTLEMTAANAMSFSLVVERLSLAEERRPPFPLTPGAKGSQGSADHSTIDDSHRLALPVPGARVYSEIARAFRFLLRVRR